MSGFDTWRDRIVGTAQALAFVAVAKVAKRVRQ